ncbi:MAG: TetR family transcriptional regulator [Acidimicrobiia bacterium]
MATVGGESPRAQGGPGFEDCDGALARNQAARRRRVLDATLALAAEGGFEAVQMRDVATAANVALGTVYRYFSSKERLLLEANVEQIEELGRRLRRRPPAGATAADRVIDVLTRADAALQRRPEVTGAMVRALGTARPEEADEVRRITAAMTAIITGAMHEPMHEGQPSEHDLVVSRVLSQVWFSALIGHVGGVDSADQVVADLTAAARLLLHEET